MNSISHSCRAPGIAAPLVILGLIANVLIAQLAYGDKARVFFGKSDWMGDFLKHVMSFPGPPLAPSMFPNFIDALEYNMQANTWLYGHFHNTPETVLITLAIRPLFAAIDPVIVYMIAASLVVLVWGWFVHRFADPEVRPRALGLAVLNYPMLFLLERGNLFAGITAICLLVVLCRRRLDWTSAVVLAVAANIRPNVLIVALPLLSLNRETLIFILRTGITGALIGLVSLASDGFIYPAYTLSAWLGGLAAYNSGYVVGPLGVEFVSSLWGAFRQFVPVTGANATLCTLAGLIPLGLAWFGRDRMSYAAKCFLAIAACTLSAAVLTDYHLIIFVAPLLLLERDDPAYWPIFLGSCWMLIPKNYNPEPVLSWQTYLNPAGLVVAAILVVAAYRAKPASPPVTA